MKTKILTEGLIKFLSGFLIIAALIFIPAGSLRFLNGWVFMGILFIPMLIMGVVLFIKNPELLKKRLNSKEKESEQKIVVLAGIVMFLAGFITAGLNYRFKWTSISVIAVVAASVVFLLSYVMYAQVLRENTYLSRTVEVQEEQKVIDTGLYGIVRHPMYTATLFMFLSIPIILGSVISIPIFLIYPVSIAARIKNEEKVLESGLKGYTEYKQKVKYRLIPFVW